MTNENNDSENKNKTAHTDIDCQSPAFKKRILDHLLYSESHVSIHLNATHPLVGLPIKLKQKTHVVLDIGHGLSIPIPDLVVSDTGITCTLSFDRRPCYCSLPFEAIFAMVKVDGAGITFTDSMPPDVLAEAARRKEAAEQAQQAAEKKFAPEHKSSQVKKPRPSHLRLVK